MSDSDKSGEQSAPGSDNLSETVSKRPRMPSDFDVLRPKGRGQKQEGARASSEVDSTFDAEQLFAESILFRGLSTDEVREIMRACEQRNFEAGDVLFQQGDPARALYMLQSGEIEVSAKTEFGGNLILAQLGPGAVVGEMALLEGGPRSATVEVLSSCVAFMLSQTAFHALREQKRHAAYKLILNLAMTLGDRRRQADARVWEVFENPAQHIDVFESQLHELMARLRKA